MIVEIGNVYSRLTVIGKAEDRISPTSGKARRYWTCQCSCAKAKIIEVREDGLKGGTSNSCGCLRDEAASLARKGKPPVKTRSLPSLLGNVYGMLTVISLAEPSVTPKGRKLPRWNCMCECGNSHNILHEELRKGVTISCGCVSKKYFDLGCKSASDEFILKAKAVHGDLYNYENSVYTHSQEYLKITCSIHGDFEQWPSNHLQGRGCPSCAVSSRSHDKESFVERSVEIHGDTYDYSFVDFVSSKEFVSIVCKEHGIFVQKPSDHLSGRGCQICGNLRKFIGLDDFIERSNIVHNNKFDYSKVIYEHSTKKVEIVCPTHGSFFQQAAAHLQGQQCQRCAGEERAAKQHWNYIKRCELNPKLATSNGVLYLLEMSVNDERFLKVGISSEYKKRLNRYTEFGLDFEVLKVIETTAINSAILEAQVLKFVKNQDIRYIPSHEFKGWTECAEIHSKELLMNYYEELNV